MVGTSSFYVIRKISPINGKLSPTLPFSCHCLKKFPFSGCCLLLTNLIKLIYYYYINDKLPVHSQVEGILGNMLPGYEVSATALFEEEVYFGIIGKCK
jgi:hypothetical protein